MARLSLWNGGGNGSGGKGGNNYRYIDRIISQYFGASGAAIYIHKMIGPNTKSASSAAASAGINTPWVTTPNSAETSLFATESVYSDVLTANVSTAGGKASYLTSMIQDPVLMQNTRNKYDPNVYEMRMCQQMADNDFDLTQFGLMATDVIYGEVHLNDMLAILGRKIYAGDVIELPNERDDAMLDPNCPAANRFFVVQDAYRAADGYSATWYPHIWRFKLTPMPAAPEYADILNAPLKDAYGVDLVGATVGDTISNYDTLMRMNEAVVLQAEQDVSKRNFETRQFYVVPAEATGKQYPWIFAGDGIPPNGATLLGSGVSYPRNPSKGEYFLRTDYEPHALFMWTGSSWEMQEQDYRGERWDAAGRVLLSFINNDKTTRMDDGTTFKEKTSLWKAINPINDPLAFPDKAVIWNALRPGADI